MKNGDWRINRSHSMTAEGRKQQYERIKDQVFTMLGVSCAWCGFDDKRALQIDHIKGGGSREHRVKSGTSFLYHVLKNTIRYQILCANCNWIKRSMLNEKFIPLKG